MVSRANGSEELLPVINRCTPEWGERETGVPAGLDFDGMAGAQLASAEPVSVSHMDFAGQLSNPHRFKTLFVWNTNPVASAPNQEQLRRALRRDDLFTVVIDCFQTDSVDYADIVLPGISARFRSARFPCSLVYYQSKGCKCNCNNGEVSTKGKPYSGRGRYGPVGQETTLQVTGCNVYTIYTVLTKRCT